MDAGAPVALVTPDYWDEACRYLARRDRVMNKLIPRFGTARLRSRGDAFTTLARSIVGQQVSVKAAQSVWEKVVGLGLGQRHHIDPVALSSLSVESMRAAGLSVRKVEYLRDLARHFVEGCVHETDWGSMGDEAIIEELVAIRGIGRWTAEMFLIFNQLRPDVFPLDDIGLQKAVALHYFAGQRPPRKTLAAYGERWRPWRSVATWYLWRSLDPQPAGG